MADERWFVDSSFVVARFNRRDEYHTAARTWAARLDACRELWTTEAILLEIGAAFRDPGQRVIVGSFWDTFHTDARCRLADVSGALLSRGMDLFRQRPDKTWSLADCISFVVMTEQRLTEALSCDRHFTQAGFRALLLEPAPA